MGEAHSSVPYRLIFVDVDGVLNNVLALGRLSDPLVELLAGMIKTVGASVVLSSAWRLTRQHRQKVIAAFLRHGIPMPISCTPRIKYREGWKYARVQEILAWLQCNTTIAFLPQDIVREEPHYTAGEFEHDTCHMPVRINVSRLVVLDDIDLRAQGGPARRLIAEHHFVLTLMRTGLTEHNIKQAQHILTTEPVDMVGAGCDTGKETFMNTKILLPYRSRCEWCNKEESHGYDIAINKYFCHRDECRKDFNTRFVANKSS